jgi:hypothetical protein
VLCNNKKRLYFDHEQTKIMYIKADFSKIFVFFIANLYPKLLANGKLEDKELNFIVMPKYDIDIERLFQM